MNSSASRRHSRSAPVLVDLKHLRPARLEPLVAEELDEELSGRESPAPSHHSAPRAMHRFGLCAVGVALMTALFALWMAVSVGGPLVTDHFDDLGELFAAACAAISCLVASRDGERKAQLAWRWVGASCGAWAAGEAVWSWFDIVHGETLPFPSLADVGFLAAVPLAIVGILFFPSAPTRAISRLRSILDGLLLAGSLLFLSWATTLGAAFHAGAGSLDKQVISLVYPLCDVLVATVAIEVLVRTRPGQRSPLGLIVAGLLALAVADSGFAYLNETGSFGLGNVVDTGWVAGYLLIALAPLSVARSPRPVRRDDASGLSRWQVLLPYAMFAIAAITAIEQQLSHHHLHAFLIVDGLALIAVILVRQVVTLFENAGLTRRLERVVRDLSEKEATLSRQTMHDPLTGLGNRLLLTEQLEAAVVRFAEHGNAVALLFLDLDGFKYVNDAFGHADGDRVLVAIGARLAASVRPSDCVVRLGGDEFAIVLQPVHDSSDARRAARRIIDAVREPIELTLGSYSPRMSIGIASSDKAGPVSVESLLRDADIALYVAKVEGGHRFRVFEPEMGDRHLRRLELQADLSLAISEGQFFLEYQPVLEVATLRPVGLEALLRWRHPRRGVLLPSEFLSVAEDSRQIVQIGRFAFEQALADLALVRASVPSAQQLWVAVNISARQLETGTLEFEFARALEASQVDPDVVHLELTESAFIDPDGAAFDVLSGLTGLGLHLGVDDFGTGYSSLTYLQRLPIEMMKVDRSFVAGLGTDHGDTVIVEAIVQLAHALGIVVVAEGVEEPAQLDRLRALACEYAQGHLWSYSLDLDAVREWLRDEYRRQLRVVPVAAGGIVDANAPATS